MSFQFTRHDGFDYFDNMKLCNSHQFLCCIIFTLFRHILLEIKVTKWRIDTVTDVLFYFEHMVRFYVVWNLKNENSASIKIFTSFVRNNIGRAIQNTFDIYKYFKIQSCPNISSICFYAKIPIPDGQLYDQS